MKLPSIAKAGYTLAEMAVYCALTAVMASLVYGYVRTGALLSAKNSALTRSHADLKGVMDRLGDDLQSAKNIPTLIDTTGATVSSPGVAVAFPVAGTEVGPAAGIKFDRFLGSPYILNSPTVATTLAATTTSISVWRSTDALGAPAYPQPGDVLLINGPGGEVRARISAVFPPIPPASTTTPPTPSASARSLITLTLSSALGKSVSWAANQPQLATLVRPEALVVVPTNPTDPANGYNELRRYSPYESGSLPTTYNVLTRDIGNKVETVVIGGVSTSVDEGKPFSTLKPNNGPAYAKADIRIRARDYDKMFKTASGQARGEQTSFNTFFRLSIAPSSRLRPRQ